MCKGALELQFKFGLMRPTENINRYIAVGASKADQAGLIKVLQRYSSNKNHRKYKKLSILIHQQ